MGHPVTVKFGKGLQYILLVIVDDDVVDDVVDDDDVSS